MNMVMMIGRIQKRLKINRKNLLKKLEFLRLRIETWCSINGYDNIYRTYETGKTDIIIPPFSISTCISIVLGDVNFDGLVDVSDIILLISFIVNNITLENPQIAIADINKDDFVNIIDIITILNIILST